MQRDVMDGTMVVITDRTLYRDVDLTGIEDVGAKLEKLSERFDNTRCEGCTEPPTGAYSGKLPIERVQSLVTSADPTNVVRIDPGAPAPKQKIEGVLCCGDLASRLWPVHHVTVSMAPHGVQLRLYLNNDEELRAATALLRKAASQAKAGQPTVAASIARERRRKLSLVPMAPLVMDREATGGGADGEEEEEPSPNVRASRASVRHDRRSRASRRDGGGTQFPRRERKRSVTFADASLAQRASRFSSRVWPMGRGSRTSKGGRESANGRDSQRESAINERESAADEEWGADADADAEEVEDKAKRDSSPAVPMRVRLTPLSSGAGPAC